MPKQLDWIHHDFLTEYFDTEHTYPGDRIGYSPIPMGEYWTYISNTFLNGFINYVKILDAYVAGRYHDWDEIINAECPHTVLVRNPTPVQVRSRNDIWVDIATPTKNDAFRELTRPGATFHVKPDYQFQDDVHILAKATNPEDEGKYCYFYFWYDRDCSDCCIGRFLTDDTEAMVREKFTKYMETRGEYNPYGARQIPLHYFNGWIS